MSTTSLRHPLTRALLVLTFTTGVIDAASHLGLGPEFGIAGGSGLPAISLAAF